MNIYELIVTARRRQAVAMLAYKHANVSNALLATRPYKSADVTTARIVNAGPTRRRCVTDTTLSSRRTTTRRRLNCLIYPEVRGSGWRSLNWKYYIAAPRQDSK